MGFQQHAKIMISRGNLLAILFNAKKNRVVWRILYDSPRGGLAPNLGPGLIRQERAPKIKNNFKGIPKVVCCTIFLYLLKTLLEYCY